MQVSFLLLNNTKVRVANVHKVERISHLLCQMNISRYLNYYLRKYKNIAVLIENSKPYHLVTKWRHQITSSYKFENAKRSNDKIKS